MYRKLILSFAVAAFGLNASAQFDNSLLQYLDQNEDTTNVTTVKDIVAMQQRVQNSTATEKHFNDVWRRRGFFNISKNNMSMTSSEIVTMNPGNNEAKFKNDWGIGLQAGKNYRLHRHPIANMVNICLDYSWLDLNVNHFKAEPNPSYDSSKKTHDGFYYIPWNLKKFEFDYGMSLGPSVTVAPFIPTNVKGLHHFRLQGYFHIGYSASLIYIQNNEDADSNTSYEYSSDHQTMASNMKMNWGHGLFKSFGFNVSWKRIGIGYEHKTGSCKYKPVNIEDFGDEKSKFNLTNNRLYLTFRM